MTRGPDSSHRNECTRIPTSWVQVPRAPSLRDQFAQVGRDLHAPTSPGYQLFAVDGHCVRSLHLQPHASSFAIMGRHSECDLAVADDPSISLRHLLLRAVTLEHGGPALRVIDLATPQGFQTDDGAALAAVVAEGPFAFRVGRCAVFAIPWGVALSLDLPTASSIQSRVVPRVVPPSHPYREPGRARWQTHITMVPPPASLAPAVGDEAADRVLSVRCGITRADVPKSLAALSSGVLLGRYARCDASARGLMSTEVSRVHALVLHEGGEDLVFDLASTNGISHNGAPARRAQLADGDRLQLAPGCHAALHIRWHHRRSSRAPLVWN